MIRLHFCCSSVWFSWCDTVIDCSSVMAVSALKNVPNKNHQHGQIFIEWSIQIHPWKIKHILLIHSENLHLSPFCGYYECMSNFALYLFIEASLFIWRKKMVCSFKRILRRLQIRVTFQNFLFQIGTYNFQTMYLNGSKRYICLHI